MMARSPHQPFGGGLESYTPRSRLFPLTPRACGTPYREGLASYLIRLAQAHCVPVGVLLSHAFAPLLPKPYVAGGQGRQISRFLDFAASLNGLGVVAADWVQVLTSLTCRPDLSLITMLPWANVLSERGLLRATRQWCPRCYEEWQHAGQVVYDPLLWAIASVSVCPRHVLRLVQQCHRCQQTVPWLSWHAHPGHCTVCSGWLGSSSTEQELSVVEETQAIQSAELVGTFLATAATSAPRANQSSFTIALTNLIQRETQGNQAAFARLVGLPKTTLWELATGRFLPQMPMLVRLCLQLQVSLPSLLTGKETISSPAACQPLPTQHTKHRRARQALNLEQMHQALEDVLADTSSVPPSLRSVALRFGYPPRTLTTHVPELCQAISRRYQAYRKAQGAQKIEALRQKVRATAYELYAQGHLPTYRAVGLALGATGYFREQQARTALHEVWRELGWE